MFLPSFQPAYYILLQLLLLVENFPVTFPKKLYHFTLVFDSSHETVQKMPASDLLVCETFVVTLCQHLSVFMSTQIVYYPLYITLHRYLDFIYLDFIFLSIMLLNTLGLLILLLHPQ